MATDGCLMTASLSSPETEVSAALLNEFDRQEMQRTAKKQSWQHLIAPFRVADHRRSWAELAINIAGVAVFEAASLWAWHHLPLLLLLTLPLTAGFLVRIFIISHDCGHGSYFNDQKLNDAVGVVTGFFLLTPYHAWRRAHAIHHATTGDLDRRGTGDVLTLTVTEYQALSPLKRLGYRLFRNPFVLIVLGAFFVFFVLQRFTNTWGFKESDPIDDKERQNVHLTTLVGALIAVALTVIGGWELAAIHYLAAMLGGAAGIFLFYAQHQYEDVYWRRHSEWEYLRASVEGSSWLELPEPLRYFSGNIGVHHIHHLAPKVPNYKLYPCLRENEMFRTNVHKLTLGDAFRCLSLKLWDAQGQRMITWRELSTFAPATDAPSLAPAE